MKLHFRVYDSMQMLFLHAVVVYGNDVCMRLCRWLCHVSVNKGVYLSSDKHSLCK